MPKYEWIGSEMLKQESAKILAAGNLIAEIAAAMDEVKIPQLQCEWTKATANAVDSIRRVSLFLEARLKITVDAMLSGRKTIMEENLKRTHANRVRLAAKKSSKRKSSK